MKKQRCVFTLAGVTAVAGAVLATAPGCGTGPEKYVFVSVGPEAGNEPPRPAPTPTPTPSPAPDAAPPAFDASADAAKTDGSFDAGAGICPTSTPIDATTFPWKPPSKTVGACTQAELDAFVAFVDKTDDPQKWKDGPWTANAVCRDCVFAPETTVWPPMILNAAGQLSALNVGGCIALKSGIEGCGRNYQQWRACYLEACSDCPDGDANAFSKCVTAANKLACKKAFDDVIGPTGCGNAQTAGDAETACQGVKYVFEGGFKAQCIGP